ncbi:MAG TPA: hypothetical protein VJU87_10565 [Gemmatimonadaceae bacterium]|nr:hypothetical protein [Gemmatimonadaceae bacterium]
MAGLKLDGAGQAKMKTLDDAMNVLMRVNGLVEQYALALKRNQPTGTYTMNIRRQLPSLAEKLKNQFGMISDQVMQMNLASSRGASEQVRVRTLREGVAVVKQALEIALTQTKDKHAVKDEKHEAATEDPA